MGKGGGTVGGNPIVRGWVRGYSKPYPIHTHAHTLAFNPLTN